MPFLRFTRDRRGYESTCLVHAFRRRGKSHSRVLYWYRTPPDVKVGRSALDEDAIRLIEESSPELVFDWPAILAAKPAPAPAPAEGRRATRSRDARSGQRKGTVERAPGARRGARPRRPEVVREPELEVIGENAEGGPLNVLAVLGDVAERVLPQRSARPEEPALVRPARALEALVNPDVLARFRARHAEALARISERVRDPARAEALRVQAERLNPDTWVTEAEVRAGLARFDADLEALRSQLGRGRRRRSRRGGVRHRRGRRGGQGPAGAGQPPAGSGDGVA